MLAEPDPFHPSPQDLIPAYVRLDGSAYQAQLRWRKRFRRSLMVMAVIAFVSSFDGMTGTFGDSSPWALGLRWVSIIMALGGALYELYYQFSHSTLFLNWTVSRAEAEFIRSEVWYYLLGVSPKGEASSYTAENFAEALDRLPDTDPHLHIPAELAEIRASLERLPTAARAAYYLKARVLDQQGYYTRKVSEFERKSRTYTLLRKLAVFAAAAWGSLMLLDMVFPLFSPLHDIVQDLNLIGTFIGLLAINTAYFQAEDTANLLQRYHRMAEGLAPFAAELEAVGTEAELARSVEGCEHFLRAQNNEWSIKRRGNGQ